MFQRKASAYIIGLQPPRLSRKRDNHKILCSKKTICLSKASSKTNDNFYASNLYNLDLRNYLLAYFITEEILVTIWMLKHRFKL